METAWQKWEEWNCGTAIMVWRALGLLLLSVLWLLGDSSEAGLVLLLLLGIMALARRRFALPGWAVLIDQAACLLVLPFWPGANFALALPFFEALLVGQPWLLLPGLFQVVFYAGDSRLALVLGAVLIQAAFTGWALRGWNRESRMYRLEADRQRRDRYELERLKGELLMANVRAARTAELTERNRIARQLHDDVGHELTAAVLALQAFEQLWREEDAKAGYMLSQVKQRLGTGSTHLREAVHNIKPLTPLGADRLREIAGGFTACPVSFQLYGDTEKVPAYLWSILEPCLKEALTNVARHANASRVDISLDVSPHIVRLSVHDNGEGKSNGGLAGDADMEVKANANVAGSGGGNGIGIRNIRQRARAVGGSVSVDTTGGFRLVCVLPIAAPLSEK